MQLQVQVPLACGDATPPPPSSATASQSSSSASPQPPTPTHGTAPPPEHLAQEESPVPESEGLQGFLTPAEGIQISHEAPLQVSLCKGRSREQHKTVYIDMEMHLRLPFA